MTDKIIVGLGHQKQVGKDTAARVLVENHGFRKLAFADRLRDMAYDINPVVGLEAEVGRPTKLVRYRDAVDDIGYERAKQSYHLFREFLQHLGVAARDQIDEDVWVDVVLDFIADLPSGSRVVVSDVRFPNEFEGLKQMGAHLVKITRPGTHTGVHYSEIALLDHPWDVEIRNDGTISDLEEKLVDELMFA